MAKRQPRAKLKVQALKDCGIDATTAKTVVKGKGRLRPHEMRMLDKTAKAALRPAH